MTDIPVSVIRDQTCFYLSSRLSRDDSKILQSQIVAFFPEDLAAASEYCSLSLISSCADITLTLACSICFFFANLASVILFVLFVCVWKVKVLNMIKRKKKARETKIKSNLEMRFVLLSGQIYCKWGEIKDKSQQMYHLKRKVLLNNTGVLLDTVCIVHTEIEN